MKMKTLLALAREGAGAKGTVAAGVIELFATPQECGWPEPEVGTYADGTRYASWDALGDDIGEDELRGLVAMLGRTLAEIES